MVRTKENTDPIKLMSEQAKGSHAIELLVLQKDKIFKVSDICSFGINGQTFKSFGAVGTSEK